MQSPGKIGKYTILETLGKGAMGIVYKGFDPGVERHVALKIIRKELLGHERAAEIVQRFRNEAQAGGRLQHPGIVSVYEYGEDEKTAFIAMEFVEGRALSQYIALKVRFELADTMSIMAQLLDALDYAHEHGIVHRDVKPANVLLSDDKQVKVVDFGVARLADSDLTKVGAVIGTPSYMSPEQLSGQQVDRRSDLFSAGIVLYELLTGKKPFDGAADEVMRRISSESPEDPSLADPAVPATFDNVVTRALAKQPKGRYASAREFADALFAAYRRGDEPTEPSRFASVDATMVNPVAGVVAGTGVINAAEIERGAERLMPYVGPIAKVLAERASVRAPDRRTYYQWLSEHIDDMNDQVTFLKEAGAS